MWLEIIKYTVGMKRALNWYANIRMFWLTMWGWIMGYWNFGYRQLIIKWYGTDSRILKATLYQVCDNKIIHSSNIPQLKNRYKVTLSQLRKMTRTIIRRKNYEALIEFEYWNNFKVYKYTIPWYIKTDSDNIEVIGSDPYVFPPQFNDNTEREFISAIVTYDDGSNDDIFDSIRMYAGPGADFYENNLLHTLDDNYNTILTNYKFNISYIQSEKKIDNIELIINDNGNLHIKKLSLQEHHFEEQTPSFDDVQDIS